MLVPTFANRQNWLYAIGNTRATSLTRSIPIGRDAKILSLGCGDVRNILYTCYVERGLVPRKIDVTCCDYDEKVLGRNIILLTFLLDKEGVEPDCLWSIYYHLFMDDAAANALQNQVEKVLALLVSLQARHNGTYGSIIRICDRHSLADIRQVCRRILDGAEKRNTGAYTANFEDERERTNKTRQLLVGEVAVISAMRSAAPLSIKSSSDVSQAFKTYCKHGTVTAKEPRQALVPNPMFASLVSETEVLHYGTDPLLGYHLATAYAPLSKTSPLRPSSSHKAAKLVDAAKTQFFAWITAFREIAQQRLTVRFTVADAFAFCHTLQHAAATSKLSANWYRRQWDLRVLELNVEDYGAQSQAPTSFDAIDTSNLSDHIGLLNIIIATSSLLKPEAWATLHTETMIKRGKSYQTSLEQCLCGNPATMSLLLGVSPVQYLTNATSESHVDEAFMSNFMSIVNTSSETKETQLHGRLSWKRDDWFSGQPGGRSKLHIDQSGMVRLLFQVYQHMFLPEKLGNHGRSATYAHFHRPSFASLLRLLKHRVKTDWQAVCSELLLQISQDRALRLSNSHVSELNLHLNLQEVSTEAWLLEDRAASWRRGPFQHWKTMPLAVAVTVVVPRSAVERLHKGSDRHIMASPTLIASLSNPPWYETRWENLYSDVHLVFGTVRTSPESENTEIAVEVDGHGWHGSSPLIASFLVPAAVLQVDPINTIVSLCVKPSAQAMALYLPMLGPNMIMFESPISVSSVVHFSSMMPNQTSHRVVCGGLQHFQDAVCHPDGTSKQNIIFEMPDLSAPISTMTAHVDVLSQRGRKLLEDRVPIEFRQQDPFTIDVVFGKNLMTLALKFALPVLQSGSRSRVARKSGYVEVIAPLASPKDSEVLFDFIFPTRLSTSGLPVALNALHLNLDALPVLNLGDKIDTQWLVTLTSLQFSPREKILRNHVKNNGIVANTRVNFKESLFTIFMVFSGKQGSQTNIFALNHPQRGGLHILIFVSAMRLDADTSSVVLDAAVIPLTNSLVSSPRMRAIHKLITSMECCGIQVNDEELLLWKRALPALAERCRAYKHCSDCEYKRLGATIPLSIEQGHQLLCSCGNGKLPNNFIPTPGWNSAVASNAIRVAISPTFSAPFYEDILCQHRG